MRLSEMNGGTLKWPAGGKGHLHAPCVQGTRSTHLQQLFSRSEDKILRCNLSFLQRQPWNLALCVWRAAEEPRSGICLQATHQPWGPPLPPTPTQGEILVSEELHVLQQ